MKTSSKQRSRTGEKKSFKLILLIFAFGCALISFRTVSCCAIFVLSYLSHLISVFVPSILVIILTLKLLITDLNALRCARQMRLLGERKSIDLHIKRPGLCRPDITAGNLQGFFPTLSCNANTSEPFSNSC